MQLLELSDATSFLDFSRSFLVTSEAENNLLLSSAWTLARSSMTRSRRLSFFVVEDNARVVCAALNSSERRLLISQCSPEAATYLAHELQRRDIKIRGVLGPRLSIEAFSAAGGALEPKLSQKILRLETLLPYTNANGLLRVAKEKDLKLLLKWSLQFATECALDESQAETEETVHRYVENRQLFIWEDSRPVAMAGFGGVTPNGVRVNMVYTDPLHRSKGYAGSLVHVLSRRLLQAGHKFCYLFTDATNPVSNRVYERLGYKAVCDFSECRVRDYEPTGLSVSTTG